MKIHKRRVKRARQISPIGNGERGRGNAKAHMYPPEEEEGWGRHSMLRRGAGTGGLVLAGPVPSRPVPGDARSRGSAATASAGLNTCPRVRFLSPVPREHFGNISLGSVGLLRANIFSLAGKVCGHCSGPRDKIRGAECQGGAELLWASAPVSRTPVLVGNEGCDGLWSNRVKRLGNPLQQTFRGRQVMCSWSPHSCF